MATPPEFLARLGLTEEADERAVRRAYARELKLIDQERDLEGFQHLRACYETALARAASRAAPVPAMAEDVARDVAAPPIEPPVESPVASAGASPLARPVAPPVVRPVVPPVKPPVAPPLARPVAPPAPPVDEQLDPAALSGSAFADFRARMQVLAAAPERMGRDDTALLGAWKAALREALADPRLLHLDARASFEYRIAALLAEGWQPGHHLLLPAAVETFGWDDDRHALERLGPAGARLDEALEQRAMFLAQDGLVRAQQREVLHLLRQGDSPDASTLGAYARALATLTDEFPTLLHIVAQHRMAMVWRGRITDDLLAAATAPARGYVNPSWERDTARQWIFGVMVLVVMRLMFVTLSPDAPQPRVSQATHGDHRSYPPMPIYQDEPVPAERIEAIRQGINYVPGNDVPPGRQSVNFQVFLDADGSVLGMNTLQRPGDPAYATAVAKAIRAAGPFPRKTVKVFTIGFHNDVVRVPAAYMAEIRRRIDYRPGKDVPPGEQRVRFEVLLNDRGAIRRMKVVMAPRDPAYAQAVEHAIRSVAPFSSETPRSFRIWFYTVKPKPTDGH
jgi:hypothetical protein